MIKYLTAVLIAATALAGTAQAQTGGVGENVNACLNAADDVSRQSHYEFCVKAHEEARQKALAESVDPRTGAGQSLRDVYWSQSALAASLAMIQKVTLDQTMGAGSCALAHKGQTSASHISAEFKK